MSTIFAPPLLQNSRRGYRLVALAALSFGIYLSASQLAYAAGANAAFLIIVSTALRTLTLRTAAIREGHSIAEIYRDPFHCLGSGFLQAVSICGIIAPLHYIPGPVMITIVFSHTLMLLALLAVRGQERLTPLSVGTSAQRNTLASGSFLQASRHTNFSITAPALRVRPARCWISVRIRSDSSWV